MSHKINHSILIIEGLCVTEYYLMIDDARQGSIQSSASREKKLMCTRKLLMNNTQINLTSESYIVYTQLSCKIIVDIHNNNIFIYTSYM